VQVLSDRVDALTRQIDDLESKAQSLQTTIDRLNVALAQSVREESSHKDKVNFLAHFSDFAVADEISDREISAFIQRACVTLTSLA
jgi:uncharacterized coiled-coil protein SlyX